MLITERVKTDELIGKLDSIPLGRMYQAGFKALMRLQLYFTGRTHELVLEFRDKAEALVLKRGGKDQVLDGAAALMLQTELAKVWGDTWSDWIDEFQEVRREAGRIAFGVMAVFHDRLVVPISKQSSVISESVVDGVFEPQLRMLMDVAENYLYGDSLNLSGRIWRVDRETRDGINSVLLNGIQKRDSAWNIAKDLEQFLGAGEDCPRWTSTRLYGRSKKDLASGDVTGLLSGNACDGSGVAYNALRLARTEIQKIHNLATDRMMAQQPWVEEERVHLSAAHPETDICDEVTSGGRDSQGIYAKGETELPLHPNCLCYKTAVLLDQKEFTSRVKGWMNGTESWSEMDKYASDLGVDLSTSLMPASVSLAVWLLGENLEGWMK